MRVETDERRPAHHHGTPPKTPTTKSSYIVDAAADRAMLARRHRYAVYVLAEQRDGRIVGQVYTSLHPAERKVARTRERGLRATMTLVELRPVGVKIDDTTVPSTPALPLDSEVV